MSSGSVAVDGAELKYVREGHGEPLFIVGSAIYYPKAFSPGLRDHFDLIFADSRHFVPSYQPEPEPAPRLALDRFTEDVEVVREHLGVERMAVLGHSVHAQIALSYARRYPDRVSHLVLVAGVPYAFADFADDAAQFLDSEASAERKALLGKGEQGLDDRLTSGSPTRSFAISYLARTPLYWADPRYDATGVLDGLENGPAFEHLFAAVPSRADVRRSLELVQAPTLVVLGRLDFAIPFSTWDPLVARLGHVTRVLMDQDSHNPQRWTPSFGQVFVTAKVESGS